MIKSFELATVPYPYAYSSRPISKGPSLPKFIICLAIPIPTGIRTICSSRYLYFAN